ncbi:MAG: glycosyltransferase [Verrucomicrobiales bacterium]|nr:glycosyltransferase [Verrucomicrobiales bacterium]
MNPLYTVPEKPLISIVIPVKNEKAKVAACLDAIFSQSLLDFEIIAIDSGSTDGTLDILRKYPIRVVEIPSSEFNHGDTRNLGARLSRGQFVVMTVADARPCNEHWLANMFRHFQDSEVLAVCGRQVVPHEPQNNPLDWFKPISQPSSRIIQTSPADFEKLSPGEQLGLCRWDDVTAFYRRQILLATPFPRVGYAEDAIWCRQIVSTGGKVVFEEAAMVWHYHLENPSFAFKRTVTLYYHFLKYFHYLIPPSGLFRLPRMLARCLLLPFPLKTRLHWFRYNFTNHLAAWGSSVVLWTVGKVHGLEGLRKMHEKYCARPPQPVKTS